MEAHQVKAALEHRAEEVCEHLLPGGRVKNGRYKIGSLSGEKGDSRRRSVLRVKSGTERSAVFSGMSPSSILSSRLHFDRVPVCEVFVDAYDANVLRSRRGPHGEQQSGGEQESDQEAF